MRKVSEVSNCKHHWIIDSENVGHCKHCLEVRDFGKSLQREGVFVAYNMLGKWLKAKCEEKRLSLRQVAKKAGVSHQTMASLANGKRVLPRTIKLLAEAFGGDNHQRIALEDELLVLAGYRIEQPEISPPQAEVLDIIRDFSELKLKVVKDFAIYLKNK